MNQSLHPPRRWSGLSKYFPTFPTFVFVDLLANHYFSPSSYEPSHDGLFGVMNQFIKPSLTFFQNYPYFFFLYLFVKEEKRTAYSKSITLSSRFIKMLKNQEKIWKIVLRCLHHCGVSNLSHQLCIRICISGIIFLLIFSC